MKVYAFVGESGSGKSYRAPWLMSKLNIECIIDDGLLICGNKILAGSSAKREPTKIGSIRRALFKEKNHAQSVKDALRAKMPESVMVLGTSEKMVNDIVSSLEMGKIERVIYIRDIASEEEIEKAKHIRKMHGKHVIPVPTFEIRKDFSGVLLDTLHIFNFSRRDTEEYRTTKSVVRPNFSYRGDYHISDNAIFTMCQIEAHKIEGVGRNVRVALTSELNGIYLRLDIAVKYGYDVRKVALKVRKSVAEAIYEYTSINVCRTDVNVRWIETQ